MAHSDKTSEIRERIRLEDLVRDYNIPLRPAGGSRLTALCPFHAEKTPSFGVNVERQFFHCFGCQESGDIFTFVQKMENVGFVEALEMLAQRAGVILDRSPGAHAARGVKKAVHDALAFAADHFHRLLLEDRRAEPARAYLRSRGIRPETWERFRLGYSLPDWDALLREAVAKGHAQDVLDKAGLVRESHRRQAAQTGGGERRVYDAFRGRLMFPIADGQKRVVGFGARALGDDTPKYLNTPKTMVFDKSQVLYALPLARAAIEKEKRLAIVEGYTDAIAAHQEGLEFFVAGLGTAFTRENARRLRGLANRVDVIFDGDSAGQSAAERSLELLVAEELDVRVLTLDRGEDPFDVIMKHGADAFRERLDADAVGVFEFKWRRTVGALGESEGGANAVGRAFDEVLDLLARVPNVVTRKLHARELAERLGVVSAEEVERRLLERTQRLGARAPGLSRAGPRGAAFGRRRETERPRDRVPEPAGDGAVAGSGVRGGSAGPGLEEIIIETLLIEPDRAAVRWSEIPAGTLDGAGVPPGIASIARALGSQIAGGQIDVELLVGLLDTQEAVPLLARLLARIDEARLSEDGRRGAGVIDTDEQWRRCLREIERARNDRKLEDLRARKERARVTGDADRLLALEREYCDLLRKMKRAPEMRGERR